MLLFIDDRPCAKNRPCSFNFGLFERKDIDILLLRFSDSIMSFPEDYLNKTKRFRSFIYDYNRRFDKNISLLEDYLLKQGISLNYFCCMSEPKQEVGHKIAKALGLKSHSDKTVRDLRNKYYMKNALNKIGINTASYMPVTSLSDIMRFRNRTRRKVVVKPMDMYGAIDATIFEGDDSVVFVEQLFFRYKELLVEEYIEYEEWECCALISQGTVFDIYISRMPIRPILMNNTNLNANISLPFSEKQRIFGKKLEQIVQKIVNEFAINDGYIHMEYFYNDDSEEIIVSELAHRFPGCEIALNHGRSHGFDIINATIDCYLEKDLNINYSHNRYAGDLLLPYKSGEIERISTNAELLEIEGVYFSNVAFDVGEILPSAEKSSFLCSGWVLVEGDTYQSVVDTMIHVLQNYILITKA